MFSTVPHAPRSPPPAALLVGATVVTTLLRRLRQRFDSRLRAIARIRAAMQNAKSYKEWHSYAAQLDALGVRDPLEAGMREGKLYDRQLLLEKMAHLRRVAASGSVHDLMVALRTDLIRNVANITKSQLHEYFWDVPDTIKGYLEEVRGCAAAAAAQHLLRPLALPLFVASPLMHRCPAGRSQQPALAFQCCSCTQRAVRQLYATCA